ncbi:Hypothetical protein A7982_04613 [Minicystis rosea]|nr:Hypothetical protein A7982_04613 [Minicystis rosea]
MANSFAALVYRPTEIPDRALAQGFAVALAGWDVPAPSLQIAPLAGVPGHAVAFFETGEKVVRGAEDEAFDGVCEIFEDELPPALAVLDAAAELGQTSARVYAITYAEGIFHDDVWRFDADGFERHFVHEGEDGVEAGEETPEGAEDIDLALPEGNGDARAIEQVVKAHRGSTFLAAELGAPALAALVGALYAVERRVIVRLVDPAPDSIAAEVERLDRALHRTPGRGAFEPPPSVAGRATPAAYAAFVRAYDWADPNDAADLYRELAIGSIEGTLRFLRREDLARLDADEALRRAGVYPIAKLTSSALGGGGPEAVIALAQGDDRLVIVRPGKAPIEAGPTFGELVRYLALGWSKRSDSEEEMIGALMLRARMRCEAPKP